jgi:hypothetical protein
MQKVCDNCKRPVKDVGKLFKVKFMMLCKSCRNKLKNRIKR